MRVPKQKKTIGWLFGLLEQEKNNLGIQDYSVSQTTLEQIFQSFANQSIASDKAAFTFIARGDRLVLQNPDHEMTDHELSLSQRGLSFNLGDSDAREIRDDQGQKWVGDADGSENYEDAQEDIPSLANDAKEKNNVCDYQEGLLLPKEDEYKP